MPAAALVAVLGVLRSCNASTGGVRRALELLVACTGEEVNPAVSRPWRGRLPPLCAG